MKKILIALLLCSLIVSCTTTGTSWSNNTSTVSSSADLTKYKYVYIPSMLGYNIVGAWFDFDVQLFDALGNTGLIVLGEKEAESLSPEEKEHLVMVRYVLSEDNYAISRGEILVLSFYDYTTLRPVYSCYCDLYYNYSGSLQEALLSATSQIKASFQPSTVQTTTEVSQP